jgi:hypothetical protein
MLESLQGICAFEVTMQGIHRDEYAWERGSGVYVEDATWLRVEQRDAFEDSLILATR